MSVEEANTSSIKKSWLETDEAKKLLALIDLSAKYGQNLLGAKLIQDGVDSQSISLKIMCLEELGYKISILKHTPSCAYVCIEW